MSRNFNGSSDYLQISSAIVTPPFSFAGWFRPSSVATGSIWSIQESPAGNDFIRLDLVSTGVIRIRYATAGTQQVNSTSTTVTANTWHHAAGTVTTALREVWLDGGGLGSNSVSQAVPSPLDETEFGRSDTTLVSAIYYGGDLSGWTFWSGTDVITSSQVTRLAAGIDPRAVKPENIVDHWDFIEGRLTGVKGNTWSIGSGTTVAATHPKLFFVPQQYQSLFIPGANVTKAITGIAATGAIGNVKSQIVETITSNAATGAVGNVVQARPITGIAATGAVGNVKSQIVETITGNAATGAIGNVGKIVGLTRAITGNAATGAVGNVASAIVETITGSAATGAVGIVGTVVGGNVTVAVTGVSATGSAGSVSAATGVIGRRRRTRIYRVNLYDPDAIKPEAFESDKQAVKELIQESIYIGGLAAKIAAPYRSDKRYQAAKLQSQAKTLRKLVKAYQAEIAEREREEKLLLLM